MSEISTDQTAVEGQDGPSDEEVLVNGWRFEQFSVLGFDLSQVATLVYSGVDLNVARRLIASGCSPAVALGILL